MKVTVNKKKTVNRSSFIVNNQVSSRFMFNDFLTLK